MNVWEASDIQMNLVNLLGKSVFEQKQSISRGFNQIVLNIPPLSTGIYNLEVTSKDGTQKKIHKIMRL